MPHFNHSDSASPASKPAPAVHHGQLRVNDGALGAEEVLQLRHSYPDEPAEELYRRYRRDGYVLIKGLLPREDVLAARQSYFEALSPTGVLKPGTAPVEGIFDDAKDPLDFPGIGAGSVKNSRPGETTGSVRFVDEALKQHTASWYAGSKKKDGESKSGGNGSEDEGFCNHPDLRNFVAKLTAWGDDTLSVRRTLLRNNTPGNKAIGVHYDQSFMRYGEPTAVTAWVPMGDISLQGGGLIYLEDGDELGEQMERDFAARAKAAGMSDEEIRNAYNANMMQTGFLCDGPAEFGRRYGKRWMVSAFDAGDVVFHTPHMIHASTINDDETGRIRLGTDLRFVNKARPWDTRWDKDYEVGDGL